MKAWSSPPGWDRHRLQAGHGGQWRPTARRRRPGWAAVLIGVGVVAVAAVVALLAAAAADTASDQRSPTRVVVTPAPLLDGGRLGGSA